MNKNQIMKILISALVGITIVLGVYWQYLTTPFNSNQLKIGASYMTMNNDFYKVLNNEIEKIVVKNDDVLYTRDPALSIDKQVEQIESFIAKDVNIIIINPVDASSKKLLKVLKKAKYEGIKIVVVDSQLSDNSSVDSTIVSDNYQAGVLCAQHLMKEQSSASILLLEHAVAVSGVDRIKGFTDTIKGHDSYQVVDRRDCLGQTEIAMPQVQAVIEEGTTFDTVMALNDQAAIGALAAIKDSAYNQQVAIYGVDGSPDMKSILATSGELEATVAQSPMTIGKKAIQAGYQLYRGNKVASEIIVPVKLVTANNISDYDLVGWQ